MSGSASACTPEPPRALLVLLGGGAGTVNETVSSVRGPWKSAAPVPVLPLQYQGTNMADEWPLRDFIELGALPSAIPCARLHARQLIWEWGLAGLSSSAELLVSELVTNAMRESRSMEPVTPVRLWLLGDRARILILVWDSSPRAPARKDITEDAEGGRGLLLVETISSRWGWYFPHDTDGKVVWAECDDRGPESAPESAPHGLDDN
jgi:anti-sigma regulatory factor (Ser/Thr protein kinase)